MKKKTYNSLVFIIDGAFFTDAGLEPLEVVGPFCDGSDRRATCNLYKNGDPATVCRPPLRWLSQFLPYEKEFNCFLWRNCSVPFLWWNGSIFIRGK